MEKFTMMFRFPCNVQSNSPQAEVWRNATPETNPELFGTTYACVIDDDLYVKKPKHYVGVINRKLAGGRWEKAKLGDMSAIEYLKKGKATAASFRGAPRAK